MTVIRLVHCPRCNRRTLSYDGWIVHCLHYRRPRGAWTKITSRAQSLLRALLAARGHSLSISEMVSEVYPNADTEPDTSEQMILAQVLPSLRQSGIQIENNRRRGYFIQ